MSDSNQKDVPSQRINQTNGYLWVLLALTTGVLLAQGLVRMGIPALYPFIQDEFGLSRAQVGLVTSFLAAGFGVAVVFGGWLTDTFGVKRIVTIALFVLAASIFAFPLAYSFPLMLGFVAFFGIVTAPMTPGITRVVVEWFPVRIRALAMGTKQTGIPIAGALTAVVLPILALTIGWRMAAAATGLLVLVIAVTFALLYRDAPQSVKVERKFNLIALKTMFRNRNLMTTIIWGATFVGFQFIALSYFMLFVIEELEVSPIMAGGLLAIAQVSSIFARIGWGAVSDFIFRGRRIVVLGIIGFLTILWMMSNSLMAEGVPSITVYLTAIVIGISTLSFQGVFFTLIGEQSEPGQLGMTIGVGSMAIQVSQILMPPLFGYLVDISNSYSLGWRVTALVALAFTLALLAFDREPRVVDS